ncbi:alpha/beta hydrolase [Micromonospora sp. NPDC049559]|uniref:alpha/beta hydrolase family protein n=1 Tax=Micromonospora sp. NPDC049559 TaxID=3155923 RepID=UPI00343A1E57
MVPDPRAVLSRPAPPPDLTVRYGDAPEQLADLRLPAPVPGAPRPLVVVVHGGFWRAEYDRTHTGPLAADLAARGYPVAQLEYRRTGQPGGGWPGTLADVRDGVAALPALVAAARPGAGYAPGPPILLGHSAGGHLALHCAAARPAAVRAVLALAPVADLGEAYRLDLDDGAVAALLGGGPDRFPERYAAADPVRAPALGTPTVVLHGTLDQQVPVRIGRRYVEVAAAAGAPVSLVELPECEHFGLIDPWSPAWPQVVAGLESLVG